MRKVIFAALVAGLVVVPLAAAVAFETRTLDGSRNNERHPDWGRSNTEYLRVAAPNYADGVARPVGGPSPRYVSNRIFNDKSQNLFSENGVTQWGFAWGQFLDHTFGLREEAGGESAPIVFDPADPLEEFRNDFGSIGFTGPRLRRVPGPVAASADQYRPELSRRVHRLRWRRGAGSNGCSRDRSTAGCPNSGPRLLLDDGYLPRRDARGDAGAAPAMAADGRLAGQPERAMVAGDVRANENIALTATHTLFAREHNRIVAALPRRLDDETRFEIARRVVGAEQQYITYNEFLPALGVRLSPLQGLRRERERRPRKRVRRRRISSAQHDPRRARVHRRGGGLLDREAGRHSGAGRRGRQEGDELEFVIPLNVAFFNPDLLQLVGLDAVLAGLGAEAQYKNDEQIDNQLRSVLFQVPVPGNPTCLDGPTLPACFNGVADIAAIDIARGRDHGMPRYNDLRKAYGLKRQDSFTEITGESSDRFPADPEIDPRNPIDDPDILDFVQLFDANGQPIELGSEAADGEAVVGIRRTTLAARLKAIYRDVDRIDAFVGMAAERHVPGTEFGELQLAIWKKQFEALRDGDRFFYLDDPVLRAIERDYGISYRHTLGEIIELNTGADVAPDVFHAPPA